MLLPVRTASENIRSESPNLTELQRLIPKHGDVVVQTILIHALNELKDLVNVGKNLTNAQIAYLANRIKSRYWMLKPEEVKFVLYRAVEREKLFDRLDPNIVLSWFADYDDERTEAAIRLSDQEASQIQYDNKLSKGAMTWETYVESLWNLALYADAEAVIKLCDMQELESRHTQSLTKEELHQKEVDFKRYFYNQYIKNKK